MARGRVAWALCIVLLTGACGGKSTDHGGAGNQAGSAGHVPSAGSAGSAVSGADSGGSAGSDTSGAGGEAGGGYAGSGVRLTTAEWETTLGIQLKNPPGSVDTSACGIWFTIDFVDDGDTLHAFLGADGNMVRATFTRTAGSDVISLSAPISLVPRSDCPITGYQLQSLDFSPAQGLLDHIGQYSMLSVSGTGVATFLLGDEGQVAAMTFDGQGYTDTTAPRVSSDAAAHNPIDLISLSVSEPLQKAKLYLEGQTTVDFTIPQPGDAEIRLESDQVLPFSGTWQLAGLATDFAGHALSATAPFKTLADPGVFLQDGFEGAPLAALLTGNAQVIDQTSGVSVPSGNHALLISPVGGATLHLSDPSARASTLTMTYYALSTDAQAGTGVAAVQAATIGGRKRAGTTFAAKPPFTAIDAGGWKVASAPSTLVVNLPEQGTDVVVSFVAGGCGNLPCSPTAYVIDDLKLQ